MCDSDVNMTVCRRNPCDLYHLQVCSTNVRGKVCKWGERCKFRHLYNDVQGHSHENNKRRHDRHYDHYGNHLTSSQNNYRYRDGPNDSWSYVRSDGKHQNKRASYNPNIHKNHNINNKHVYSDVYEGYRNHTNSHQGPQMDHPNEKYNQNVNFLGYRQNPMDWPTPMEKLFRTLREFFQVGSNGWDPVRR